MIADSAKIKKMLCLLDKLNINALQKWGFAYFIPKSGGLMLILMKVGIHDHAIHGLLEWR
jgi:hypothetical protein